MIGVHVSAVTELSVLMVSVYVCAVTELCVVFCLCICMT